MKEEEKLQRIALLNKAKDIAIREHDYSRALEEISPILEVDSYDLNALLLKGNILDMDERSEESLECYQRALEIDSQCVRAIIDIGDWFSIQNETEKAIHYYDNAIFLLKKKICFFSLEDEIDEVYTNKILLLKDLGRINEAKQAIKEALREWPSFSPPVVDK